MPAGGKRLSVNLAEGQGFCLASVIGESLSLAGSGLGFLSPQPRLLSCWASFSSDNLYRGTGVARASRGSAGLGADGCRWVHLLGASAGCRAGDGACLVSQPGNLGCRHQAVVVALPDLVQGKYWVTFQTFLRKLGISRGPEEGKQTPRLAACLLAAPSCTKASAPRHL